MTLPRHECELSIATHDLGLHDDPSDSLSPKSAHSPQDSRVRETLGFPTAAPSAIVTGSPMPDPNGLGWPGKNPLQMTSGVVYSKLCMIAKSTVSRLNATPAETAAREQKLANAVRTILECIGEDPDREGLLRTPLRYAQALLWMTRGYEERLSGGLHSPWTCAAD
jgi:GTP cyclohydrolase I